MSPSSTFVFDTNALISAALLKNTTSARAYDHALRIGKVAYSETLLAEFAEVILRKKFDRYFKTMNERLEPIRKLEAKGFKFKPLEKITASTDPDDNMVLELAVAAKAACIISGDPHLLTLHPFHGIPIINAATFLSSF